MKSKIGILWVFLNNEGKCYLQFQWAVFGAAAVNLHFSVEMLNYGELLSELKNEKIG